MNVKGADLLDVLNITFCLLEIFYWNIQDFWGKIFLGTILAIDESTASLDRVAFISTVRVSVQNSAAYLNLSEQCPTDSLLPDRATIILSQKISQ